MFGVLFLLGPMVTLTLGQPVKPVCPALRPENNLWQATIELPPGEQERVFTVTFGEPVDKVTLTLLVTDDVTGPVSQRGEMVTEDHRTFSAKVSPNSDGHVTISAQNAALVTSATLEGEFLCGGNLNSTRTKRIVVVCAPPISCREGYIYVRGRCQKIRPT